MPNRLALLCLGVCLSWALSICAPPVSFASAPAFDATLSVRSNEPLDFSVVPLGGGGQVSVRRLTVAVTASDAFELVASLPAELAVCAPAGGASRVDPTTGYPARNPSGLARLRQAADAAASSSAIQISVADVETGVCAQLSSIPATIGVQSQPGEMTRIYTIDVRVRSGDGADREALAGDYASSIVLSCVPLAEAANETPEGAPALGTSLPASPSPSAVDESLHGEDPLPVPEAPQTVVPPETSPTTASVEPSSPAEAFAPPSQEASLPPSPETAAPEDSAIPSDGPTASFVDALPCDQSEIRSTMPTISVSIVGPVGSCIERAVAFEVDGVDRPDLQVTGVAASPSDATEEDRDRERLTVWWKPSEPLPEGVHRVRVTYSGESVAPASWEWQFTIAPEPQ